MALPIPFSNPRTYAGHSGIDFAQPRGTAIRASGPGTVSFRSQNARAGNMFWVDYDGYPGVAYAHLDNYNGVPSKGTRVKEGDIIGYTGNSGNTTGPHLHMEVAGNATTAGFWKYFAANRIVSSGSASGGTSTQPIPVPEMKGFLMALSDAQQAQVYDALVVNGGAYYKTDAIINILREETSKAIASIAAGNITFPGANYNAFVAIINATRENKEVKLTDEQISTLANAIAPLVKGLSDADLARIASAVNDEAAKRLVK